MHAHAWRRHWPNLLPQFVRLAFLQPPKLINFSRSVERSANYGGLRSTNWANIFRPLLDLLPHFGGGRRNGAECFAAPSSLCWTTAPYKSAEFLYLLSKYWFLETNLIVDLGRKPAKKMAAGRGVAYPASGIFDIYFGSMITKMINDLFNLERKQKYWGLRTIKPKENLQLRDVFIYTYIYIFFATPKDIRCYVWLQLIIPVSLIRARVCLEICLCFQGWSQ